MIYLTIALLYVAGVAFKTFNFGRYCWGQGNRRGAIGLWLYTLITLALPIMLLMRG